MAQSPDALSTAKRQWWKKMLALQLALFLIAGAYAVWTQRYLYADGSHILLMILRSGNVTNFYPARYFSHVVTQYPTVFLYQVVGLRDIHLLSAVYGAVHYLLPVVSLLVTWACCHRDRMTYMVYPLLTMSLLELTVSGFIISESHLGTAIVWPILFLLIFPERLSVPKSTLLIVLTCISLRTYESFIFLIWPLVAAAIRRSVVAWRQRQFGEVAVCVVCGLLLLNACRLGVESVLNPHDVGAPDGFVRHARLHLFYPPVWFTLVVLVNFCLIISYPRLSRCRSWLWGITALSAIVAVAMPLFGVVSPGYQYYSRVQTVYVPLGLMSICLMQACLPPKFSYLLSFEAQKQLLVLAGLSCVTAFLFQMESTFRWDQYRQILLTELKQKSGVIRFEESIISQGQTLEGDYPTQIWDAGANQFNWGWSLPSLCVVLGALNFDAVSTVITAPQYVTWQPFNPEDASTLPNLDKFHIPVMATRR